MAADMRNQLLNNVGALLRSEGSTSTTAVNGSNSSCANSSTLPSSPSTDLNRAAAGEGADPTSTTATATATNGTAKVRGIKAFFCIVCQDHTAQVAIQPCGHICLCEAHSEEMRRQSILQQKPLKCPLCQVDVFSYLTLQGIETL
mmetsp:Transcript_7712/g.13040  ORF Transcript_7712/g.13040 Transcript_7712/m.13040 type:complete len:145 (-) Transcript_7712:17-451(-)